MTDQTELLFDRQAAMPNYIPPEIDSYLSGYYRLAPDGTITEAMDLSLDSSVFAPSRSDIDLLAILTRPRGRRRGVGLFLFLSLFLLVLSLLLLGMALTVDSPVAGFSFHPAPDGVSGTLFITRRTNPRHIALHDEIVSSDIDGVPFLGTVQWMETADDGATSFWLGSDDPIHDGTLSLSSSDALDLVVWSLPLLGSAVRFISRNFVLSLTIPMSLLLVAVVLFVLRRQEALDRALLS